MPQGPRTRPKRSEGQTTLSGTPPAMRLATEIAAQFRHVSPDEAADRIASHIRRYWDPRMRAQLIQQVNLAGSECDAHVRAAAGQLTG